MAQEEFDKAIQILWDTAKDLQKENEQLKELCDKYEEEHKTTFKEWQKDIQANKKAIEYINTHDDSFYQEKGLNEDSLNNLLNILEGNNEYNK